MDSLIPGMLTKNIVSWIAFQSLSEMRTAFPLLPVIVMGSWVDEVSSISRYNFFLASVAVSIAIMHFDDFYKGTSYRTTCQLAYT